MAFERKPTVLTWTQSNWQSRSSDKRSGVSRTRGISDELDRTIERERGVSDEAQQAGWWAGGKIARSAIASPRKKPLQQRSRCSSDDNGICPKTGGNEQKPRLQSGLAMARHSIRTYLRLALNAFMAAQGRLVSLLLLLRRLSVPRSIVQVAAARTIRPFG
jgi:hypothetical protein